jgi:autotransporter-associated beta strand protein
MAVIGGNQTAAGAVISGTYTTNGFSALTGNNIINSGGGNAVEIDGGLDTNTTYDTPNGGAGTLTIGSSNGSRGLLRSKEAANRIITITNLNLYSGVVLLGHTQTLAGNVSLTPDGSTYGGIGQNTESGGTSTVTANIAGNAGSVGFLYYVGATNGGVNVLQLNPTTGNTYQGHTMLGNPNVPLAPAVIVSLGSVNAIPHGTSGTGNVKLLNPNNGATNPVTLDLNGQSTITINGLDSQTNNNSGYLTTATTWIRVTGKRTGSGSAPVEFKVGDNNANGQYAGQIIDGNSTLSLTKIGTGTQTLYGNNTYTGLTKVSGGTLALSGSGTISNSLDLDTGTLSLTSSLSLASLVGNGTITGGQAVAVNSTFGPGHSIGQIDHTGAFTLGGSSISTIEIDLSSNTFDELNVSGLLTYDGTLNVLFTGSNPGPASFNVFDFGGFTNDFDFFTYSGLGGGQTASFDASTGIVSITAVPEPGTFAMLLFGSLMLWAVGRKRISDC